ncbi:MAG: glycosyltransferase family 4 protein [bacterium]
MKVCFVCYQSVGLIRGGPLVKIIQTKKYLDQLGIEVDYFNMWEPAEKLLNYDLVHLFAANLGVYSLARDLWRRKVKFVVNPIFFTRHTPAVVRTTVILDSLIKKVLSGVWQDYGFTRDICDWSQMVLPNTIAEGKLISRGLGISEDKIEVVPNGVSPEFMNGDPSLFQKKYGIKDFILSVGHIGPNRKNVLSLIKALGKIDHPAVIIGRITPGDESEACLKEAEKNNNLIIIDGLDHDSPLLASAYAACDVFVLPSKFETPGRAALEAALTGSKIVITPYGGTKEYFMDFAHYVNPYSVSSILKGIESALESPSKEALKEHIKNNFLWDTIAEKTLNGYKKVLMT